MPYAENLRHVLGHIEGHLIAGYADGGDAPDKQLSLVPDAVTAERTPGRACTVRACFEFGRRFGGAIRHEAVSYRSLGEDCCYRIRILFADDPLQVVVEGLNVTAASLLAASPGGKGLDARTRRKQADYQPRWW